MVTLTLCWSTNEGCEWLHQSFKMQHVRTSWSEVRVGELDDIVKQYVNDTMVAADQLVSGWQRNGEEDVTLFVSGSVEGVDAAGSCFVMNEVERALDRILPWGDRKCDIITT